VVTKDIASDAQVRLEIQRATFNELASRGHIADWRAAFEHGDAKATGIEQFLRLRPGRRAPGRALAHPAGAHTLSEPLSPWRSAPRRVPRRCRASIR
jgi:hypothetical protein